MSAITLFKQGYHSFSAMPTLNGITGVRHRNILDAFTQTAEIYSEGVSLSHHERWEDKIHCARVIHAVIHRKTLRQVRYGSVL
jgi:hypothetical protein